MVRGSCWVCGCGEASRERGWVGGGQPASPLFCARVAPALARSRVQVVQIWQPPLSTAVVRRKSDSGKSDREDGGAGSQVHKCAGFYLVWAKELREVSPPWRADGGGRKDPAKAHIFFGGVKMGKIKLVMSSTLDIRYSDLSVPPSARPHGTYNQRTKRFADMNPSRSTSNPPLDAEIEKMHTYFPVGNVP